MLSHPGEEVSKYRAILLDHEEEWPVTWGDAQSDGVLLSEIPAVTPMGHTPWSDRRIFQAYTDDVTRTISPVDHGPSLVPKESLVQAGLSLDPKVVVHSGQDHDHFESKVRSLVDDADEISGLSRLDVTNHQPSSVPRPRALGIAEELNNPVGVLVKGIQAALAKVCL
jgi:hypothetical protein